MGEMKKNAAEYPLPAPTPPGVAGQWYRELAGGRLAFQRCGDCRRWQHPPRLACAGCGGGELAWEQVSGRGRVFSWTVTHRPLHGAFAQVVPYAVVIVELEERIRLVCSTRGISNEELRLDLPVLVEIAAVSAQTALPFARPAD